MDIAELNLSVRTFNALCRAGIRSVQDLSEWYQYRLEDLQMWVGKRALSEIGDALAKFAKTKEETMADHKSTIIVTDDYTRAVSLTRTIIANAQAAQQSLYEVCKGLKEMRDGKLYKELGYQNFEDYTENEVGIKRHMAQKYIAIADMENGESIHHFEQIGVTKLALLAKLDEPTRQEITEAVDIDAVTVKDLKAQIAALTQERDENEHAAALLSEELDSAKESLASKDKQFQAALDAKDAQLRAVRESGEQSLSDCKAYLNGRIHELENRICEMENAPIDHEMTDADTAAEIAHLRKELEDAAIEKALLEKAAESKARKAADAVRHELTQMHETELQTLREGYEKQLAETGSEPNEEALDEARFNSFRLVFEELVDELENLLETMHDDPRIGFINRLDNYWTDNLLYLKREGEGAGA